MPRFGRAYPLPLKRRRYLPVTFDAVGAGGTQTESFNYVVAIPPFNHTSAGNAVLVALTSLNNGQAPSFNTGAASYGGVAMTSLLEQDIDGQTFVQLFGLILPPTLIGTPQSVTASVSSPGSTGRAIVASLVSYKNVGTLGPVASSTGNSGSTSQTVVSSTGETVVNAIGTGNSLSSYNQSSRYSNQVYANAAVVLIGDAPGASSVSFTSSLSSSTWASISCRLMPVIL